MPTVCCRSRQGDIVINRVVVDGESYFLLDDLETTLDIRYVMDGKLLRLFTQRQSPDNTSKATAPPVAAPTESPATPSDKAENGAVAAAWNTTPVYLHGNAEPSDVKTIVADGEVYIHVSALSESLLFPAAITDDAIRISPTFVDVDKYDTRYYCNDYTHVPDLGNVLGVPPFKIEIEGAYSKETYYYSVPDLPTYLYDSLVWRLADNGFTRDDSVGVALDFRDTGDAVNAENDVDVVYTSGSTYVSISMEESMDDGWVILVVRLATH